MTRKICLLVFALATAVYGAPQSTDELSTSLKACVQTIASGQIEEGVGQLIGFRSDFSSPWAPKERAAKASQLRDPLNEMRDALGVSKRVTHISTVFLSSEYARIRILDQRSEGGILWSFFCEKNDENWGVFSYAMKGDGALGDLFEMFDAADYIKGPTKSQTPISE